MGLFGGQRIPHPGCHVGARVRNTVPGDFHVDTGVVIETSGTHDVSVRWDDEATPDPSGRTWWTLDVNVEYVPGT
jgi:hypothetical protein